MPAAAAEGLAARNLVVLNLEPRGVPLPKTQEEQSKLPAGYQNIRAWVIGKNMAGMRAGDIMRGVDLLVDRPDVDAGHVRAAARDVQGVWLLMAAAIDPRIGKIWLDQTPHSLRAALEVPDHPRFARRGNSGFRPPLGSERSGEGYRAALRAAGPTPPIGWGSWRRTWRVSAITPSPESRATFLA